MKPIEVTVHWSESSYFPDDDQTYLFYNFEALALRAALAVTGGGYDKTMVTARFDNDDTYFCRLDLAKHDDRGFQDHLMKQIHFMDEYPDEAMPADLQRREFIDRIEWPDQ